MNKEEIKGIREKYREKSDKDLSERVRHEAEDTLKWIRSREARGYTSKESLREIEKSINKKK